MEPDNLTEALARMWMECDPNRGGTNPDDPIEDWITCETSYGGPIPIRRNPLAGKPNWHWFIPRAEASKEFLAKNGFVIVEKTGA